jgi:hypothetical protein
MGMLPQVTHVQRPLRLHEAQRGSGVDDLGQGHHTPRVIYVCLKNKGHGCRPLLHAHMYVGTPHYITRELKDY